MVASSLEPEHLGVGIDTARYGHHVSFVRADRDLAAPGLPIAESQAGYNRLKAQLEKLHCKHGSVHFHIHIDAAGQYATNLEYFLRGLDLPITVSVGEPKRNKDYRQAVCPKLKSDASESLAMARFAIAERPKATPATSPEIYALRKIASRLEAQVRSKSQAVNRLHNLLSCTFPELATITHNVAAGWVLQLLEKYPTPERIARAALKSLTRIPYVGIDKANKVQAAAKETVASLRGAWAEPLVRQAVAEVRHAQQGQQELENLLLEAFRALPPSGHLQLVTIPGIGEVTAAVLVAKIVSIDRFLVADNLVGYFGIFPQETSSGVDRQGNPRRRRGHMSRKGNDLVRRYLFCAAKSAIVYNPACRALYARLRARGTRGDVALGHCMAKLLHLVFAVWKTDTPFDPQHHAWQSATQEAVDGQSTAADDAQEETAGPKRDVLPARKEVTAAASTVIGHADRVNRRTDSSGRPSRQYSKVAAGGSIDYAYLRTQITIEEVLREIGHFDALRGNTQLRGPCPLHKPSGEQSRCFSVNLQKNVFRCLDPHCAAHGNALDLWAAHRRLPVYEAALSLAEVFHLETTPKQRRGNP